MATLAWIGFPNDMIADRIVHDRDDGNSAAIRLHVARRTQNVDDFVLLEASFQNLLVFLVGFPCFGQNAERWRIVENQVGLGFGDYPSEREMLNREFARNIAPEEMGRVMLVGRPLSLVEVNQFRCLGLELHLMLDKPITLIEAKRVKELIVEAPLV